MFIKFFISIHYRIITTLLVELCLSSAHASSPGSHGYSPGFPFPPSRMLMVPFSPLCLRLRHRPVIRVVVSSLGYLRHPWGVQVVPGPFGSSLCVVAFGSSLGCSGRPWSVCVVLGVFALSLWCSRCSWGVGGVGVVVQPFASSLGYSWRPWAIRGVPGLFVASLGGSRCS